MNATCPECNTELDEDFGIVTCVSCGAVCSIDLDGSVVVQSDNEMADVDVVAGVIEVEDVAGDTDITGDVGSFEDLESLAEEFLNESPEVEVEASPNATVALSSQAFFKGLDIFSDQLESKDHFHTFFDLFVSGFETKKDLKETLELTLDDRLEVTVEKVLFDTDRQEFRVAKVNYLRLVNLHKRLSTLAFVKLDWLLSESPKALELSEKFVSPLTAEESLSENLDFSEKSEESAELSEEPTQDSESTGFVEESRDSSMVYDSDLTATSEIANEDLPPPFEDEDLNTLDSEDDF